MCVIGCKIERANQNKPKTLFRRVIKVGKFQQACDSCLLAMKLTNGKRYKLVIKFKKITVLRQI